ncbi:oligosaccharide flippase family protein [Candidatus Woesearchaeota archaeon]|nr:oligosaccharide flippase family protein [Candidatus Woesearchaeota archaeon]
MKKKIIQSFAWNATANYVVLFLEFVGTIVLARLLSPQDFGTIAYLMSVFTLTFMFISWDEHSYLVQTQNDLKGALRSIMTFKLAGSLILVGALSLLYPILFPTTAGNHTWLFLCVGVAMTLKHVTTSIKALYARDIRFKELSILLLTSTALSFAAALIVAFNGLGIWALLLFTITPNIIKSAYLLMRSPTKLRLAFSRRDFRRFFDYAKYNIATSILNRTNERADDVTVKHLVGTGALGLYSQAYTLSGLFSKFTIGSIGRVAASVFAKFQNNKRVLQRNYNVLCALVMRIVLFLYVPFFLLAKEAIVIVYGAKWAPMTTIAQIMVLYALLLPYRQLHINLNKHVGLPKNVAAAKTVEFAGFAIVLIPATLIAGAEGAAMAVNLGMVAGIVELLRRTRRIVSLNLKRVIVNPVIAGAGSAAVHLLVRNHISFSQQLTSFITHALIIGVSYIIILALMEKSRLFWMIRQVKMLRKKTS